MAPRRKSQVKNSNIPLRRSSRLISKTKPFKVPLRIDLNACLYNYDAGDQLNKAFLRLSIDQTETIKTEYLPENTEEMRIIYELIKIEQNLFAELTLLQETYKLERRYNNAMKRHYIDIISKLQARIPNFVNRSKRNRRIISKTKQAIRKIRVRINDYDSINDDLNMRINQIIEREILREDSEE